MACKALSTKREKFDWLKRHPKLWWGKPYDVKEIKRRMQKAGLIAKNYNGDCGLGMFAALLCFQRREREELPK